MLKRILAPLALTLFVCAPAEVSLESNCTANGAMLQFQADILGKIVQRPVVSETTALGAAYLAGLAVGFWKNQKDVTDNWVLDEAFSSGMKPALRKSLIAGWREAVKRSLNWAS